MNLWGKLTSFFCPAKDCDCDSKNSEQTEDVSGQSENVEHLNPTEVHGAQDVFGSEGRSHGRVFGSRIGKFNYNTPVGSPAFFVPPNPNQYQTTSGLYHDTYMMDYEGNLRPAYGEIWDNWNDSLPEYRFPRPWSPSYNPRWAGRPQDYQVNQVNGNVNATVTNMATHATTAAASRRSL